MIRRALLLGLIGLVGAACATKQDVSQLETSMVEQMREITDRQEAMLQQLGLAFDSLDAQEQRLVRNRGEAQRSYDELADAIGRVMALVGQNNQLLMDLLEERRGRGSGTAVVTVPAGGREAPPQADDEPSVFYAAAQTQFNREAYATARSGFEDFLANYPDHELAPDAQYFLAETYAEEDDVERAFAEYARVWELYPDSRRAPTALYKSGMLELQRGNTSAARRFFDRVVTGYPNSPEADLARDQLDRLEG